MKTLKPQIINYTECLNYVKKHFRADINTDIIIRELKSVDNVDFFIAFIDGMVNTSVVNDYIVRPIMLSNSKDKKSVDLVVEFGNFSMTDDIDSACSRVLNGDTIIFMNGAESCGVCETKGFDKRSVSSPETENVVKGSHEGFNESIRSNITLIRRAVKSNELITEMITVGNLSNEICGVLYLDGVTNSELVEEVKRRIKGIKGDYYSGSGMIEQMIEDSKFSIFPTILSTERPERAAHYLAAGRVVVVCDNSPFAIIVPITASELFDSPEGNQQRWQSGTLAKLIRIFAFLCATLLSGLYIAMLNFHREMLPAQLLKIISESRAVIPFTAMSELIIMEVFFELVREAGLRIPSAIGSAVGVVSGLILGQAAVNASIVSPVTLIIVAITGIANAAIPDYDLALGIRITKFGLIILSGMFGLLGFSIGLVLLTLMLCSQHSFGVDMANRSGLRSTPAGALVQTPLWMQELRTKYLKPKKSRQQPNYSRSWERKDK